MMSKLSEINLGVGVISETTDKQTKVEGEENVDETAADTDEADETEDVVINPVIYTKTGREIPLQQDGEPILDTLA